MEMVVVGEVGELGDEDSHSREAQRWRWPQWGRPKDGDNHSEGGSDSKRSSAKITPTFRNAMAMRNLVPRVMGERTLRFWLG